MKLNALVLLGNKSEIEMEFLVIALSFLIVPNVVTNSKYTNIFVPDTIQTCDRKNITQRKPIVLKFMTFRYHIDYQDGIPIWTSSLKFKMEAISPWSVWLSSVQHLPGGGEAQYEATKIINACNALDGRTEELHRLFIGNFTCPIKKDVSNLSCAHRQYTKNISVFFFLKFAGRFECHWQAIDY